MAAAAALTVSTLLCTGLISLPRSIAEETGSIGGRRAPKQTAPEQRIGRISPPPPSGAGERLPDRKSERPPLLAPASRDQAASCGGGMDRRDRGGGALGGAGSERGGDGEEEEEGVGDWRGLDSPKIGRASCRERVSFVV